MLREDHSSSQGGSSRADTFGSLWSQHRISVPVSPIVTVHSKQRRNHSILLHLIQLVFTYGLAVDHHITAIVADAELCTSLLNSPQHHVAGSVTIAVTDELPAFFITQRNFSVCVVNWHRRISDETGRQAVWRNQIWLRKERRFSLR